MKNLGVFFVALLAITARAEDSPDNIYGTANLRVKKPAATAPAKSDAPASVGQPQVDNRPDEEPEDEGNGSTDDKAAASRKIGMINGGPVIGNRVSGGGVAVTYSGFGESAAVATVVGDGQDKFKADANVSGFRTHCKAQKDFWCVTPMFNGQASLGAGRGLNGNASGMFGPSLVLRIAKPARIFLGGGVGGAMGDNIGSGWDKKSGDYGVDTGVFGVGPSAGVGVKFGPLALESNFMAIKNVLDEQGTNRSHPSQWFIGGGGSVRYLPRQDLAIFLNGSVVADSHRDMTKQVGNQLVNVGGMMANGQLMGGIGWVFDASNAPKKVEEKRDEAESAR